MFSETRGGGLLRTVPKGSVRGGAESVSVPARLVVVVLVVLIVIMLYLIYRRSRRAQPDCGALSGGAQEKCKAWKSYCGGNSSCLNAVAHCLPLNDITAAGPTPHQVLSCADAVARVDPGFVLRTQAVLRAPPGSLTNLLPGPPQPAAPRPAQ